MPNAPDSPEAQEFELKLAKLRAEVAQLQRAQSAIGRVKDWLPLLTAILPAFALIFAAIQFTTQQKAQGGDLKRRADADSIAGERAFMGPVLNQQMKTYVDAITAAATIAGSSNDTDRRKAVDTFWTLYWGPLVMFESPEVSVAMQGFAACLNGGTITCQTSELQNKSLKLASALQVDYFSSWKLSPTPYADRSINYVKLRPEKTP